MASSSARARPATSSSPAATATWTSIGRSPARASRFEAPATQPVMIDMRRVHAALREAEQGQAAARPAADLLRPGERLLRLVEVTEPTADVADLGVGRRAVGHVALAAAPRRPARPPPRPRRATPRRLSTTARCTRQMPGKMANGWLSSAHRIVASVHSAARSKSPTSSQAAIRLQYTLPVENGPEPALHREEHRLVEVAHPVVELALVDEDSALVCSASASRSADRSGSPELAAPAAASVQRPGRARPRRGPSPPRGAGGCRTPRTRCRPSSARRARRSHPLAMAGRAQMAWCSHSHTAHCPARRWSPSSS